MGTKNKPGDFDCYANAHPDEPMFVLLGRDPLAGLLVRLWAEARSALGGTSEEKLAEAYRCADAMGVWATDCGKSLAAARAALHLVMLARTEDRARPSSPGFASGVESGEEPREEPGGERGEERGEEREEVQDTLGDALPREMARVRDDILPAYVGIGANGAFGAIMIRIKLDAAAKALAEGDIVAMVRLYQELKDLKG